MKVYFVRHTAVDVPKTICYGQSDVGLKDSFEQEARSVKDNLKGQSFDVVYASPLSRCVRLASFCGYANATKDDRLKEFNFGDWEMQTWDDIDMSIWEEEWGSVPSPNGESFEQMKERLASFISEIKGLGHERVLVFAHAGIIVNAKIMCDELDPNDAFKSIPNYGEIVSFDF